MEQNLSNELKKSLQSNDQETRDQLESYMQKAQVSAEEAVSMWRQTLKQELWRQRRTGKNHGPRCPICGEVLERQSEMHEVFITRGMARGFSELEKINIFASTNCVLVHPGACHVRAQTHLEDKAACIVQIVAYEGYLKTAEWLEDMQSRMLFDSVGRERAMLEVVISHLDGDIDTIVTLMAIENKIPTRPWEF